MAAAILNSVTTKAVLAGAAALAGAATYVDGHYGISRDLRTLRQDKEFVKRMGERIGRLGKCASLYGHFKLADQDAEGLWFEGRSWTYGEIVTLADAFAEVLVQHGVKAGDFVAVFTTNSPEMVFTIVAITKLGAVPALINTALRNETLLHCMGVANASIAVATPDLVEHVLALSGQNGIASTAISLNLGSFKEEAPAGVLQISQSDLSQIPPSSRQPAPRAIRDIGVLIYTSGTSGKPKAVSVKNMQFVIVSTPLPLDTERPQFYRPLRIFSCLPLFHGTCIFTGLLYGAGSSGTFCLARKFSASTFSRQLVESRATRMLYVGELCRYLLKAKPSPYDLAHSCRVACGNGLQKDVWLQFMKRFGIQEIREFYRSTEGVAKFDNVSQGSSGAGKVGYQGPIYNYFNTQTVLVKYDPETETPYRDPKTGFCVAAKAGEPGEAIGRVMSLETYSDYLNDPKATEKKLIANVFAKGDLYQRMGDLLVREKSGWIHFLDRTGDTYRWRGENVSAGEVREHISRLPGVQDVTVYAAKLEGYDGQAGAAAITLADRSASNEEKFASSLAAKLKKTGLTEYQLPRLVRFNDAIEVNATFKHAKTVMQTRSWDPESQVAGDVVYWLNGDNYEKLNAGSWSQIKAAKARL